jgi:universal stress protein A
MKLERILATTDFSAAGDEAVREAATWARRHSAALRVAHVVPPKRWLSGAWGADARTVAVVHGNAAGALRRRADGIDASPHLEVSTALLTGRASKEIARAARAFAADLIVIGAHGARGDLGDGPQPLGGTASSLVASTPSALLIVRRPLAAATVVLAAVDLTPVSNAVLEWARASAPDERLHVLHAYQVAFAERLEAYSLSSETIDVYTGAEHARREQLLADLLREAGLGGSERIVVRGDAVKTLFEHIKRLDATVVVLGQHARHKGRRDSTAFGSVCRYVTSFAQTNVLVVPAAASRS